MKFIAVSADLVQILVILYLVFLNFANYIREQDIQWLTSSLSIRKPDLVGYGPRVTDIHPYFLDE